MHEVGEPHPVVSGALERGLCEGRDRPVVAVPVRGVGEDDGGRLRCSDELSQGPLESDSRVCGARLAGEVVRNGPGARETVGGLVGVPVGLPEPHGPRVGIAEEDHILARHAEGLRAAPRLLGAPRSELLQGGAGRMWAARLAQALDEPVAVGDHHDGDLPAVPSRLRNGAAGPERLVIRVRRDDQQTRAAQTRRALGQVPGDAAERAHAKGQHESGGERDDDDACDGGSHGSFSSSTGFVRDILAARRRVCSRRNRAVARRRGCRLR